MQKYFCNTCNNKFFDYSTEIFNCPYCGSNDIQLKTKPAPLEYWKTPVFIFSVVGLVVMLIVLIFLPSALPKYNVDIVLVPLKCKAYITVKRGGEEQNSTMFGYSADNGKTWQSTNELISENPVVYSIKVRHNHDSTARFTYDFENPVSFKPDCKAPAPDPCDCGKLEILTVEQKSGKVTIHSSLPQCNVLYSINGKDGIYSTDSNFTINPNTDYQAFIKTSKCTPIGYRGNPVAWKKGGGGGCGQYYKEAQVDDPKPYPSSGVDRATLEQNIRNTISDVSSGTYVVTFIVETDGAISCVQVIQGSNESAKQRIINYLNNTGIWFTGYIQGNPVRTLVRLVI
jgi:hypothetical protein